MAVCNPSTLIEDAKCFLCLSEKELKAVIAQLLCNVSSNIPVVRANVVIPFELVSGTTDSVSYDFGSQTIGWYTVAWDWIVTSTPAVWGGVNGALGTYFYFDIEDAVGLTGQLETHSGVLDPALSPAVPGTGLSVAQPIYFKHAQSPLLTISWDAQPAIGETVSGYVRILIEQRTTS